VCADIARSAQLKQSEPWTILGRFWGANVKQAALETKLTITHCECITEGQLCICINNVKKRLEDPNKNNKTPYIPKDIAFVSGQDEPSEASGYTRIGSHPHRIFDIWVETKNLDQLDGLWKDSFQVTSNEDGIKKARSKLPNEVYENTETTVTNLKINAARNHRRGETQAQVMHAQANDVMSFFG
jgi:hypothetical protein